jgi:hypothetical protein
VLHSDANLGVLVWISKKAGYITSVTNQLNFDNWRLLRLPARRFVDFELPSTFRGIHQGLEDCIFALMLLILQ